VATGRQLGCNMPVPLNNLLVKSYYISRCNIQHILHITLLYFKSVKKHLKVININSVAYFESRQNRSTTSSLWGSLKSRDVPRYQSSTPATAGSHPAIFANPAKYGSGQIFGRICGFNETAVHADYLQLKVMKSVLASIYP